MGNRDEVCAIYEPARQSADQFADRLRSYLREEAADAVDGRDGTDFSKLGVSTGTEVEADGATPGRVYAAAVTWNYGEHEEWREALRSVSHGDGWLLDLHTQEGGYMGEGHLLQWIEDDDGDDVDGGDAANAADGRTGEYVEMDVYWTSEGGYDDELVDYFAAEHGIRPLTYSYQRLD